MDRDGLKILAVFAGIIIFIATLFIYQGAKTRQSEIEQRALQLKYKECYDWQDIEVIIFGEIQE